MVSSANGACRTTHPADGDAATASGYASVMPRLTSDLDPNTDAFRNNVAVNAALAAQLEVRVHWRESGSMPRVDSPDPTVANTSALQLLDAQVHAVTLRSNSGHKVLLVQMSLDERQLTLPGCC